MYITTDNGSTGSQEDRSAVRRSTCAVVVADLRSTAAHVNGTSLANVDSGANVRLVSCDVTTCKRKSGAAVDHDTAAVVDLQISAADNAAVKRYGAVTVGTPIALLENITGNGS